MSYLDTIKFQFYPNNIKIVKPVGELTLGQFLKSIKHPKREMMQLFLDIEEASRVGDLKKKAELKAKLHYTTPAILSDGKGRSYENIISFNGIACIDVDGLEPEYAEQFKKYLFHTYKFFIATYLSPSRKGVRGLIRIPVVKTVQEYKEFYYGVLSVLQDYKGVDYCLKNPALPQYWTYDGGLLYRLDATVWDGKGIQIDEFEVSDEEFEPLEFVDPKDVEGIKLMIKRMIAKIDVEQSGHLTVRSCSLLIGGWIKYGYLPYDEAIDYLFDCMDESTYLQKGMRGYKKTAVDMVKRGMLSALKYDNER